MFAAHHLCLEGEVNSVFTEDKRCLLMVSLPFIAWINHDLLNISEFVDSSHTMSGKEEKTILENDDGARRDVILNFAARSLFLSTF